MAMKVVGGSFGVSGQATVGGGYLSIQGAQVAQMDLDDIASKEMRVQADKKFGVLGFFFGAIILSAILFFILNVLGVVLAVIVAFMGSYYTKKIYTVDVTFKDGRKVTLQGSKRELDMLMAL